jgi:hypothetical protein
MDKKVLFGVLDWGIGHATRSIALVNKQIADGNSVTIASSGKALEFLKNYYPNILFIELGGLNLTYAKHFHYFNWWRISYKVWGQYYSDRRFVKSHENEYDIIISDSRYGFFSKVTESHFITHQLNIIPPRGFGLFSPVLNLVSRKILQSYKRIIVPDKFGEKSLAGKLSQTNKSLKIHYVEYLSRFYNINACEDIKYKHYDVLIILSGPEPSRSYLEQKLVNLMTKLRMKSLILGGFTQKSLFTKNPYADYQAHLPDIEFASAVVSIPYIIARAGYSTILDLAVLNRMALLIPTPHQSEQQYLADYLDKKHFFRTLSEDELLKCESLPLLSRHIFI